MTTSAAPTPDVVVDGSKSEDAWVGEQGERFGLAAPRFRRRADRMFKP